MRWDLSDRPAYLLGVGTAALHAREQGIDAISVIEFGVAAGHGLLILEREAAQIEAETGVRIHVYGFDAGGGLPDTSGDHRDHPDYWVPGDFPMDVAALRAKLTRAELVIGDVRATLNRFRPAAPVGFAAVDVDLWSSTVPCLEWLARVSTPHSTAVVLRRHHALHRAQPGWRTPRHTRIQSTAFADAVD
jgi:hypothetical protein